MSLNKEKSIKKKRVKGKEVRKKRKKLAINNCKRYNERNNSICKGVSMMKKRSFIFKIATFLLAVAPIAATNARSILVLVGEPQLPAKLNNLKKDTNI